MPSGCPLRVTVKGWEDGQYRETVMDEPWGGRWTLHTADELELTVGDCSVVVKQKPKAINATRMGVGACLWEGELLLAAYLASLPLYRFIGSRVVELGAGPGLVGLMLAKLGAKVVLTDIEKVLPLLEENVAANGVGLDRKGGGGAAGHGHGHATVQALEWGAPGYEQVAARLAMEPVDWVLAADCCYVDQEGGSPSTPHFVAACAALCGPSTRCLVAFELRASDVKRVFLTEARALFPQVVRIPPSALPKGCQVEHVELYELKR